MKQTRRELRAMNSGENSSTRSMQLNVKLMLNTELLATNSFNWKPKLMNMSRTQSDGPRLQLQRPKKKSTIAILS